MYPLSDDKLDLRELSRHWARDLPQRPPKREVFAQLVTSLWRGELDVMRPTVRPEIRRHLLEALVRLGDDQGVAIFPDAASVPDQVKKRPDGSAWVDTRTFIVLPRDSATWDASVIDAACSALATVDPETFSLPFRTILSMQTIGRTEFERYCLARHYALPAFWFGPRHQAVATVKAKSDCRRWLEQLVGAGPKPDDKTALWRHAKTRFPNLSRRGFDEVWAETVPAVWRSPGAMKGPRRSSDPKAIQSR